MAGEGTRNADGHYVYFCADCREECTVGTPKGPATTDIRGVTRCRECHPKAAARAAVLDGAAPELLAAAKLALLNLDARARGRAKWTVGDQRAFEALEKAIAQAEGG